MVQAKHSYEPCVVSFIDVLGFREILKSKSASDVYDILKKLQNFTFPEETTPPKSMDEVRLQSQAFAHTVSDAIVRIRPYDTQYKDGALVWEIIDLLHAQIALVRSGILIRAGVAVGDAHVGLDGKGPIFGPALVRAYEVESQEAIFPRIVIDDGAIQAHLTDERLRGEQNNLEHEKEAMSQLLATGEDGTCFIDYLSAEGEYDDYFDFLQHHASLVREGLKKHKAGRVARKYQWMANYHNRVIGNIRQTTLQRPENEQAFLDEYDIEPETFFKSILV